MILLVVFNYRVNRKMLCIFVAGFALFSRCNIYNKMQSAFSGCVLRSLCVLQETDRLSEMKLLFKP